MTLICGDSSVSFCLRSRSNSGGFLFLVASYYAAASGAPLGWLQELRGTEKRMLWGNRAGG